LLTSYTFQKKGYARDDNKTNGVKKGGSEKVQRGGSVMHNKS